MVDFLGEENTDVTILISEEQCIHCHIGNFNSSKENDKRISR